MSGIYFIESLSTDSFVRKISLQAVKVLNDTSLTRRGREARIRQLQLILLEHQQLASVQAAKAEEKKQLSLKLQKNSDVKSALNIVADKKQVQNLRKEMFLTKELDIFPAQGAGLFPEKTLKPASIQRLK